MNQKEIHAREFEHPKQLLHLLPATIKGVRFYYTGVSLAYRYKNAEGLIFPDNGYCGYIKGEQFFNPLFRVAPHYSNEHKFNPTCEPTLEAAASAVLASWELFTK
jgi:hypothetical protein